MHFKKKNKGEKVLLKLHPSRISYTLIYLMDLVIIGFLIYFYYIEFPVDRNILGVSVIFIALSIKLIEIKRISETYMITPESIIHSQGLITTTLKRVYVQTLSDIILNQSPLQRLLNIGDVRVLRYTEGPALTLKNIPKPENFIKLAEKQVKVHFPSEE
ncbi:MAG: PH domain-containing protein [Minisyncoccales bacterium]